MMTIGQKLEKEWNDFGDNNAPSWIFIKNLMNSQIFELLFAELAPCSQKYFFTIYCKIDLGFSEISLNKIA